MKFLDCTPVLRQPFRAPGSTRGYRCAEVVRWALEEMGFGSLLRDLPLSESDWTDYRDRGGDEWARVADRPEDAQRLGDIVMQEKQSTDNPTEPHVSILVDPRAKLFLTSTRSRGVFVATAELVARDCSGVYRHRSFA